MTPWATDVARLTLNLSTSVASSGARATETPRLTAQPPTFCRQNAQISDRGPHPESEPAHLCRGGPQVPHGRRTRDGEALGRDRLREQVEEPALKLETLTCDEYREIEDRSEERHIFWDGDVFAMSGASDAHSIIEAHVAGLLHATLRGRPCRASTGNRRLRALHSQRAVYADAVVICGGTDLHPEDRNAATNPVVIFEVLSDSTESFDRGDKFGYYRTFPSLRAVVFLSQKDTRVERYTRGARGSWTLDELGPGDLLGLDAIEVALPVNDLYEGSGVRGVAAR